MPDDPGFPPLGQLYDIGTHKMHLYSLGDGSPVVILDAGSGDSLLTWYSVQGEIAQFARVVAYDRSGMGWSERGLNPVTPESVADELHQLLIAAAITAPLILVGHSLGGVYMRAFVHHYPEQVVGLVLVDSSHESQAARFAEAVPQSAQNMHDYVEMLKGLSRKSHEEILEHFFKLNDSPPVANSEIEAMKRDRMRPGQVATVAEEIDYAFRLGLKQPPEAIHSLGDLPLTVLTATKPFSGDDLSESEKQSMQKIFQGLQTEISQRSSRGQQIFVQDAGHYIQNDQPQAVIGVVRDMIEQVRSENS